MSKTINLPNKTQRLSKPNTSDLSLIISITLPFIGWKKVYLKNLACAKLLHTYLDISPNWLKMVHSPSLQKRHPPWMFSKPLLNWVIVWPPANLYPLPHHTNNNKISARGCSQYLIILIEEIKGRFWLPHWGKYYEHVLVIISMRWG